MKNERNTRTLGDVVAGIVSKIKKPPALGTVAQQGLASRRVKEWEEDAVFHDRLTRRDNSILNASASASRSEENGTEWIFTDARK